MTNENGTNGEPKSTYSSKFCDDDIVISGIAGRFPDSDNMRQLQENLFNKVDLITDDDRRWKLDHPEIPQRTGKINNVSKFDSLFFGVHFKQAHTMDPMCRMLLEHAYEAIIDAGINPRQLRGTRTGVFMGACFSESEKTWFYEKLQVNGFGITGCSRAMLANRISYWLGVNGPSYAVDSACSSSLFAMENAYRAIRSGECDAAIVGGANLCLHPYVSLQFSRLGVLSVDGRCKAFDADANGYTRSEAVGLVYLQKAKDAKRIYATYVHGKTNCDGFKEEGITFPSTFMQSTLLKEFYDECGIPPSCVSYIEGHGTGTKVGDPEEVNALERVFCPGRTVPLKIGSIKSNMGHAEPASGVCSIAKMVIAMESGLLVPNLHYKRPREGVKALEDGRIEVVTEVTPWNGGYVGINSFGFGGANAHVLLKSHTKEKINNGLPNDDLPRLVLASGRTEEAADCILKDVESRSVDVEFIRLLHDIHSEDIPGHMYRGYSIVGGSATSETPLREIQHYPGAKRPIWFVFSGMGSQWAGMGNALLRLPVFAAAIAKCDAVLKPRGVDIYDILTNTDKSTYDNILNCFVGIAAVQIGLVDILTHIGIVPDNIIGHSVGELGCAYADGCFTAEQMVLSAYSRGMASIGIETIKGSMAAVGLGYSDIKDLCPPDIEVACHNGPESSTISGPADSMKAFVAKLQTQKIFAREVPCGNIAYHSRYIAAAGPILLGYLQKLIPQPKPRSSKWVSTSVRRNEWGTAQARLSSAEYHTNNLLSAVFFEETSALIPKDAVTIEIAPHGLLQAILRRSLDPSVTNIALTQRGHVDNVEVMLQSIGKLYNVGLHPQVAKLYPDIQFPVSRGTPMISPLVRWEHTDDWYVTSYRMQEKITSGERTVEVTLSDADYEFMAGHVIDERNLLPATGYLALVWETVGMMRGELYTEVSVVFEDIKFLRATTIPKEGVVELTLMIQKGTGRFEVVEGGAAVVTGIIRYTGKPSEEMMGLAIPQTDDVVEAMSSRDFYKELKLRGYHYGGLFRGVKSSTIDGSRGTIGWFSNWVAFMDNMLQMHILGIDSRDLFVPTAIQKLTIDTKTHLNMIRAIPGEDKQLPVRVYKEYDTIVSGGVEIRGLKASSIARKKLAGVPVIESFKFVAHRDNAETSISEFVTLSANLAVENHNTLKFKTIEAVDDKNAPALDDLISPYLHEALGDLPLIQADVNIVAAANPFGEGQLPQNITFGDTKKLTAETGALIVCGRDLFSGKQNEILRQLLVALKEGGYLLTRETGKSADILASMKKHGMDVILEKRWKNEILLLVRQRSKVPKPTTIITIASKKFDWLPQLQEALKNESENTTGSRGRIILVSDKNFENGLTGLVNCLKKEPGGEIVRGYLLQDEKAPNFTVDNSLYAEQLQLDLSLNVLRPNGVWGTYRHLKMPESVEKPVYHAQASQIVRGDLSSLRWLEGPYQSTNDQRNFARIVYASINFRDIMLSMGKLGLEVIPKSNKCNLECPFGLEYSGIDSTGRPIMGLVESGGFSNIIEVDKYLSWPVPKGWSLEDAATVPCVYATCYYALYHSGNMKKGDKVLIHAGTGGVGQAAITLALHEGCEVFTTVGTPDKRRFIKERFPQIPDDHIGNSRDTSFEKMIMQKTNGQGVDIVLNSLAGEKLLASIRCLAVRGRFLEIGKFDLAADNPLGMRAFLREVSFYGVMLDNIMVGSNERKAEFQKFFQAGLDSGAVKPLSRTVFPKEDIEAAFRYMAAGKHIGKVLVKIHDKMEQLNSPMNGLPRFYCAENRTYVILGGLGGFGVELADWFILRGAKNIVLTSRTGIKNGYQLKRVEYWKSLGVKVLVIAGKDASKRQDCEDILRESAKLAPVAGIFNLAVVLKDEILENQTEATFEESFGAKAWGTKQLDEVSRKLCPELKHFVVFSSVVCGRGNVGQTNYAMANSVMERICERRAAEGLPALAIQWGAVGDVGLVADLYEEHRVLAISGTLQQKISSCLAEFDKFLKQKETIVSSMVVAEKRAGGAGSLNIVDTVLNIMGLKDLKSVSTHTSLAELGMDSMMAVEIKQTLEREFEIFLNAQDIRGLNFAKLMEMAAKASEDTKSNRTGGGGDESLTGMKIFVQILGNQVLTQETCMTLLTKEEPGRREVFLIPGIEGYGTVFRDLAGKIKSPATCLQLLYDSSVGTIDDMANQLLPHVLQKNKNRRDFVIAGYSFGSIVAIELARKLEAEGLIGKLILIDGSPELMKDLKNQQLSSTSDEELQSNILLGMMDILSPTTSAELVVALEKCKTWSEKLEEFISRTLATGIQMTPKEQEDLCNGVFNRLLAMEKYDHTDLPPLRSSIILLKPTQPTLNTASFDFGLSKISREKVEIYTIDGNHITILENDKVASAINGDSLEDARAFKASIMEEGKILKPVEDPQHRRS